jgi:hypothetical protein
VVVRAADPSVRVDRVQDGVTMDLVGTEAPLAPIDLVVAAEGEERIEVRLPATPPREVRPQGTPEPRHGLGDRETASSKASGNPPSAPRASGAGAPPDGVERVAAAHANADVAAARDPFGGPIDRLQAPVAEAVAARQADVPAPPAESGGAVVVRAPDLSVRVDRIEDGVTARTDADAAAPRDPVGDRAPVAGRDLVAGREHGSARPTRRAPEPLVVVEAVQPTVEARGPIDPPQEPAAEAIAAPPAEEPAPPAEPGGAVVVHTADLSVRVERIEDGVTVDLVATPAVLAPLVGLGSEIAAALGQSGDTLRRFSMWSRPLGAPTPAGRRPAPGRRPLGLLSVIA